jgi:hypothetical protein
MHLLTIFRDKNNKTLMLILTVSLLLPSCSDVQVICSPDCSKKLYAVIKPEGSTPEQGAIFSLSLSTYPIDSIPTSNFIKTCWYDYMVLGVDWRYEKPHIYIPIVESLVPSQIDTDKMVVYNTLNNNMNLLHVINPQSRTIVTFDDLEEENKWYCFW